MQITCCRKSASLRIRHQQYVVSLVRHLISSGVHDSTMWDTNRYHVKINARKITWLSPSGSPETLVLWRQHFCASLSYPGFQTRPGWVKTAKNGDFRLISCYVSETTEDRHWKTNRKLHMGFRPILTTSSYLERPSRTHLTLYSFYWVRCIQGVSKVAPIFIFVKSFCLIFCKFVGNLYSHISTKNDVISEKLVTAFSFSG